MDSWFRCNKLSLNVSKTNFILFNSSPNLADLDLCSFNINGKELNRVYNTKFLGVHIDDCLNYKSHIEYLINKLSKYVGLFYKLRHFLPLSALLILYRTLFEPHLNYCNVIWCNTFTTHLTKLISLQKKVIRALSRSEFNSPSNPLFRRFSVLRLSELNIYHNACLMFQVINKLNPRLCGLVPIFSPQHSHQTRHKHLISGKHRRLVRTGMSFVCRGPQIWNTIDDSLKLLPNISNFRDQLKKYLLLTYI